MQNMRVFSQTMLRSLLPQLMPYYICCGWKFSFFFFSFLIGIILTKQLDFFFSMLGKWQNHTHLQKQQHNNSWHFSDRFILSYCKCSYRHYLIILQDVAVLLVAGMVICILQMEKLRLCLHCKVEYIINGTTQIILAHRYDS